LRYAVTWIIGMTVAILTGFIIPFYYWLIIVGIIVTIVVIDYVRNPLGKILRQILMHTAIVVGGAVFATVIYAIRIATLPVGG
jgi:hypothetical protein